MMEFLEKVTREKGQRAVIVELLQKGTRGKMYRVLP